MFSNDSRSTTVKAWDPLVRVFHWSLVFFFLLAFATEDDWMSLHVWAGYAVAMLIGFRLLWGVIGTRTARFLTFVKPPRTAMRHLGAMLSRKAPHYLGHNPAAAMMVVALLGSISLVAFSGLILIAAEGQGPLAGTFFASIGGEAMEEVHEFFANFTLLLVFAHVAGVVVSSLLEGENLVRAMITGRKKARPTWADVNPERRVGQ
ncbi:MAG: cytochrome b/b6 domain-containing protein [Gammaproteobacteria bacterium]|nr:MAG: cytochrome B [Gammaproteobacteria bacterium]UCH39372.1 MAG: cytochrome b/b6 domain-containing protein [Gammaproteobacteria bacterium]